VTFPLFPLSLAKFGLHLLTVEDLAVVKLTGKVELNLLKMENCFVGITNASRDQVTQALPSPQAPAATTALGIVQDASEPDQPRLKPAFRLASHIIIDGDTNLRPGTSIQLSEDVYISAHAPLTEMSEVSFRAWDNQGRTLMVQFGSGQPIAISSFTKAMEFVKFYQGRAEVSDNSFFQFRRVEAGESLFLDGDSPVGITLHSCCPRPLWHLARHHDSGKRSRHYFLLFPSD
jgi:hypothetical protein